MTTVTIQDELFEMVPIEGTSGFMLTRLITFKRDSIDKRNENTSSVIKEFTGLLDEFNNGLKRLKIRHFLENSDAIQVHMPFLNVDLGELDRIVNAPYIISTQPSPSGSSSRD